MYLFRAKLNRAHREVIRALMSPQVMHAAVENCFDTKPARVLWRIDELNGETYILAQCEKAPDNNLFEALTENPPKWEVKDYCAMLSGIKDGQVWRFRLTANPTHAAKDIDKGAKRGKNVAHVTAEYQKEWLHKKAARCGFRIVVSSDAEQKHELELLKRDIVKFKRGGDTITLGLATFEGLLMVTDAQAFIASLKSGIGRAKAYGCGLMTLVQVRYE